MGKISKKRKERETEVVAELITHIDKGIKLFNFII